ncbi:MAG: KH domain-containing protein [Defluviitaleaceae bacterium]|nr:KH domain-containing protein [Defluviitaleaceae bacterium]MCL2262933.1 KH domain-containing protein [Defluviitaleaceae bacterium]
MNELLNMVAKRLVDEPDKVEVIEEEKDGVTTLRLKVAPDDMGKVIGKQGRIARAIRTLVKAAAINEEKKVNVEII